MTNHIIFISWKRCCQPLSGTIFYKLSTKQDILLNIKVQTTSFHIFYPEERLYFLINNRVLNRSFYLYSTENGPSRKIYDILFYLWIHRFIVPGIFSLPEQTHRCPPLPFSHFLLGLPLYMKTSKKGEWG